MEDGCPCVRLNLGSGPTGTERGRRGQRWGGQSRTGRGAVSIEGGFQEGGCNVGAPQGGLSVAPNNRESSAVTPAP